MIKYDVLNRFTDEVQFTAKIDCKKDELNSIKLGLAVKWGIKNNANLRNANLRNADLSDANLRNANLRNADLSDANLRNADLRNATGNKKHLKTLQLETYSISYTAEIIQIGCERHTIKKWFTFTDKELIAMDGKSALVWWKKWKPVLKYIIEISPAEQTIEEDNDK